MSVARLRTRLAEGGFTIAAPLPREDYDALVPEAWRAQRSLDGAETVLIVANAGRTLWPLFVASPEASSPEDPLDRYTRRVLDEASRPDARFALYSEQRDGEYLPLVALARRAGLGTPGRVGVLLHPVSGPWLSLRAVVFVRERLARDEASTEPFDPCTGCPAPCASACHGQVVGEVTVDIEGCYRTPLTLPACATACDARSACVIGPEHAFSREQIAHHSLIRRPARRPGRGTPPTDSS